MQYVVSSETRECKINDDNEYCIYFRTRSYQDEWVPHYRPFNFLYAYHNNNKRMMWNMDSNDIQPKDEDICPLCGRKIIIYEPK